MTHIVLPKTNQTGANEWADVEDNDQAIKNVVNGNLGDDNITTGAAIGLAKLAAGSSGQIIVCNTSGVPTYRTLSGDATISDTGVVTLTPNSVDTTALQNGAATASKVTKTILSDTIGGTQDVENPDGAGYTETLGGVAIVRTPAINEVAVCRAYFDLEIVNLLGGDYVDQRAIGYLQVSGVSQVGAAVLDGKMSTAAGAGGGQLRALLSYEWTVNLAAGVLTTLALAVRSDGAASYATRVHDNTKLVAEISAA